MDRTKLVSDLEELCNAIGVSGFEDEVRKIILRKAKPLADSVEVDRLGNVIATLEGSKGSPRVLLDAHMDEVGFIVSHIDEQGFLRFEKIGGWDERTLPGQPVAFDTRKGRRPGIIGMKPPHLQTQDEGKKVLGIDQLFVDIGAASPKEAEELGIAVGSPFTIYHPFVLLRDIAMGKAFDDRAGCAVLLDVMRRLSEADHEATIIFSFAICEEIGGRGATTAAYATKPDVALAIEGTAAADTPGIPPERCTTRLRQGPAITIADRSLIAHPSVVQRLRDLADGHTIRVQTKKPIYGSTDAGRIALSRSGVPSGVLSVPCRYIHNGISLLCTEDLGSCADLALAFCSERW